MLHTDSEERNNLLIISLKALTEFTFRAFLLLF